ncbi:right-handed parallel beta-helix repeat-containing protein [Nitrospira sp. BLG_1]|uniref:right-handed parallel beta-helix repeat-containing protein n=1 Tax=Nitrospira sp. BLG_1 TaxID=3395883 RepID=UPI0039BCA342
MSPLKLAISVLLLATGFLPAMVTHAATYYVATSGDNGNPGTSSQPWRTVGYAVSKMIAGDTTYVKGGTYNESGIKFRRSGTSASPIKLLNVPGQFPIINCASKSATSANSVLFQNGSGYKYAIGWITLEGFEIRNCYNGILLYNLHDSAIRRNWVHDNINQGVLGNGTRILFDRNRINHNGPFATKPDSIKAHGIYLNGSAITATNNLIYDNLSYGITLNGASGSVYDTTVHAGPEFAASNNWVIANNTFAYSRNRGGIVVWGSTAKNARIENNIFYENSVTLPSYRGQGIEFLGSGTGNTVRNNLAFASGSGGTKFIEGGTQGTQYTQSGNVVNTVNPAFVNAPSTRPSAPNFALTSGSLAINKGLTTSATKTSYTNVTRPQQSIYDIGAFEFYSSSTSLAAPTSLQLAN